MMIKLNKVLIGFCFLMCTGIAGFSQELNLQQAQQKFASFNRTHPHEKIFVHTDKNFYVVGELVWFKLYDDQQDQLSKIAYVDLVDATNKSVLAAKISLKENESNGSLLLPLSLNSGNYIVRAYTNWMKNTADMSFFEKPVTVVNPFKNPDTQSQQYASGYEINFFPEGGNMVKGLETKVAFKAVDKYGKGVDCKGYIVNERNEQVATFQAFKLGMGTFSFTPTEKNYKAVINFADGTTSEMPLPAVNDNGYVMNVTSFPDRIEVKFRSNYTGPQNVYLYAQNKQVLRVAENKAFELGSTVFSIPKAKLGSGVIQLTAFNANHIPVCERLYFIKPERQSNINLSLNNSEYANRKKVELMVGVKDKSGNAIPANMSVSVFSADSVQNSDVPDIESYFLLTSDIKGYIESPSYYFSNDSQAEQAADNLMLTQGWRRFTWDNFLGKKDVAVKYLPEYEGHFVYVQVTDTRTNKLAVGKDVYLSVPGKPFNFLTAVTDANGYARFNVKDLYGLKKIIVQVNQTTEEKDAYKIDLVSPFYGSTAVTSKPFYMPSYQQLLEQYSINMQVQNIYSADSMRIFYAHEIMDTMPFYGTPLYSYNLDDYTRFTTMEEVLREYVREINVMSRGGKQYLRMLDEPRKEYNEEGTLVLWDGVPLHDPHSIFKFDPLKVKRLEIIPRKYAAGELLFNGVASFTTYNADLSGFQVDPSMLAVDYEGLQLQREFYSPTYQTTEQINSRMPDFRNTLYWSPNVTTTTKGDTKINFYTADRKGNYQVVLQGLDQDGNPLVKTFSFQVK